MSAAPGVRGASGDDDAHAQDDAPPAHDAPGAPADVPRADVTPDAAPLPALTDLPVDGYEAALSDVRGARPFHARNLRRWVLQRGATSWDAMTDLSKALRGELARRFRIRRGELLRTHESRDGTVGLLTRLDDGRLIESVSIPDGGRRTLCISSQVGCAVACRFCASGLDGVERNLSAGEIVEQVLLARDLDGDHPLTNYVFMGSGEPTHNLANVLAAIRVMNADDGLGIGARRITVSTVGHPAALEKLADEPIAFNLALSLHVPGDDARRALMPGLGSSDLVATLDAAQKRFDATGRRLTAEVVLLDRVNDAPAQADELARLLHGRPVAVNLIPWNPVDGVELRAPRPERVEAFAERLRKAGVTTTVRRPRGRDVGVACGQLRRRAQGAGGRRDAR
ncbi:MAG: 23S rRNA (adenine(2503)-C(2))-methyltransferase RlmN [Planctomycetes bacterium]|nr:23S rRNA (adenine(2503)-C(2))-methyltransferase RlmN [Planctomycetota bacterium]